MYSTSTTTETTQQDKEATTTTSTTSTKPKPPSSTGKTKTNNAISSLIHGSGAHVPEDKVQYYVQTPYGRGMTVRTRRDDTNHTVVMREIELLDWKRASDSTTTSNAASTPTKKMSQEEISKSIQDAARNPTSNNSLPRRPHKPATLYSATEFPSVPPQVGDEVMTQFGRGVVQAIRNDPTTDDAITTTICQVLISSWRLAHRSRVTCYLQPSAVHVVRPKKLYERTVYEKVEYALDCKAAATKQFTSKHYPAALDLYSQAIEAVRYVQHTRESNNAVRADLLVLMITCNNNAGTCCTHLSGHWKECHKFANNALVLIEALERGQQKGPRIQAILQSDHNLGHAKLFGQYKVKSLLLQAKAQLHLGKLDECLATLKQAHTVIQTFTTENDNGNKDAAAVRQLLNNDKEVKLLHQQAKERKAQQKKTERRRAQAMFGGKNHVDKTEDKKTMAPTKEAGDDNGDSAKRRVSFSETVQKYEIENDTDEEDTLVAWYQDADFLIGLSVFMGAALAAALATGWFVFNTTSSSKASRRR